MRVFFYLAALFLLGCTTVGMSLQEARSIAEDSPCMDVGNLTSKAIYNENTKTWWIDMDAEKPGCSPACVVYENRTADVNWRCTGLIPE